MKINKEEKKELFPPFPLVMVSIPCQSSLSQGGSSRADTYQAVQTSIRMFCFLHTANTAGPDRNGQMMRRKLRKKEKRQKDRGEERRGTRE